VAEYIFQQFDRPPDAREATIDFVRALSGALRTELLARPLLKDRVLRHLNTHNQNRMCEHIMRRVAWRVANQVRVPTPWGTQMTPLQVHMYVIETMCKHCQGDQRVTDAVKLLETYLGMLRETFQHPRTMNREDWWGELHRRFYGHRRWPEDKASG
jgi:hypothetical protein